MKIAVVVGARPQFIKAYSVSKAIVEYNQQHNGEKITEYIIHTGQHFDANMSKVFFQELGIPQPKYFLDISSLSHGAMTGRMLEKIEELFQQNRPDVVLVYGDTNSTLSGALAAIKLHIPVVHVEAGLRAFDLTIPEEVNRVLVDKISSILFCPTEKYAENLKLEGINKGVHVVGDVMFDAILHFKNIASDKYPITKWGLRKKEYVLCTVHREDNADKVTNLKNILVALQHIAKDFPVIIPVHPRTKKMLNTTEELSKLTKQLHLIDPVSYLEMLSLEANAYAILTDSGGVQKEAFFHKVPCITLRSSTEWLETIELGWNEIVGSSTADNIISVWNNLSRRNSIDGVNPYGDGNAAGKIVKILGELA